MPRTVYGQSVKALFIAVFIWNGAYAKWATELTVVDQHWATELAGQEIEWPGSTQTSQDSSIQDEFSEEAKRLVANITITEERLKSVPEVLRELELIFNTRWPGSRVVVFGSLVYGLALRNSDIDCTLLLPGVTDASSVLKDATSLLQHHPHFTDLYPITWARIPVITFKHKETKFKVDLTINNFAGIQLSNMLKYLLNLDERVSRLAFVVKHWAATQEITSFDDPALSNYGLTVMLIFYLQQRNMLPSLASLQVNAEPFFDDGWNMGYNKEYNMQKYVPLDLLLGEFFKYYADFDYPRYIVSSYAGYPVERRAFEDVNKVPREFVLYKHNVRVGLASALSLCSRFVLQDVFIHNQNLAKCVDPRPNSTLIGKFRNAAKKLKKNNRHFLGKLLSLMK